ncbi:helix-turn-helix domain-containing protein [Bosea sp. Root483D1]|uniref:helix-turn-helix domain-containing protein n=1 Tax=Bosea sp. Root483D1 TaxID=1736544 RepID=UPI0009EB3FCC|nr:helix-turn-helix transcriptional regulator [Bosea sp. Root483D1]
MKKQVQRTDLLVARRIRAQRLLIEMSQEQLAARVGVSFQLIQKYEAGSARISSSRLRQIADALGVRVCLFFEEIENEFGAYDGRAATFYLADTTEGMRLFRGFSRIRCKKIRRKLLSLIEIAAEQNGNVPHATAKSSPRQLAQRDNAKSSMRRP